MPGSLQPVMSQAGGGMGDTFNLPHIAALACRVASNIGFAVLDVDLCDSTQYLEKRLPADTWKIAAPQLDAALSLVAFKLNAFESEFLS
jgi:hypothetical protein